LKEDSNTIQTLANATVILQRHPNSKKHQEQWHYRSMIGKLNYLAQ
jgi:hypothetical protein